MRDADDLLGSLLDAFRRLPGVGQRTAQRMALHLLRWDRDAMRQLGAALAAAADGLGYCKRCRHLARGDLCDICSAPGRDRRSLCVVEQPSDLIALEGTGSWKGRYFVTHGTISPLDGRTADDLHLGLLLEQVRQEGVGEVVVATNSTVEGDVTALHIKDMLAPLGVEVARIASGVPMGGELEYLDGATLARSLAARSKIT